MTRNTRFLVAPVRSWQLVGLLLALASVVGCAGLYGHRDRDTVVSAREIALRGVDAQQSGQLDQANELFANAVDVCPTDERVRSQLADGLWQAGHHQEALEHMQEAMRLSGGASEMMIRLGRMELAVGNYDRAAQLAVQTIDSGHQLAAAYRLQGDVLAAQDQWQAALARYHRALAIHPEYPEVKYSIGRLYFEHGEMRRALSTLQSLESNFPRQEVPVDLLYLEGLAYKSLDRMAPAIDALGTAVARGMKTADAYYQLADAHYQAADFANARWELQRALQLDPQHAGATQLAGLIDPSGQFLARQPAPTPLRPRR